MNEIGILKTMMLFVSKRYGSAVTLWRNNTGSAWMGQMDENLSNPSSGYIVLRKARPVKFGLCNGSSDLIGITETVITQDMVGQTIGRFTALEVKNEKGKASEDQENFIDQVKRHGGIAGVVRNPYDIASLI